MAVLFSGLLFCIFIMVSIMSISDFDKDTLLYHSRVLSRLLRAWNLSCQITIVEMNTWTHPRGWCLLAGHIVPQDLPIVSDSIESLRDLTAL